MAGIDLKIQVLRKSISTFSSWLDGCDRLLATIPKELDKCDQTRLRQLALEFRDLLLQMKERCTYAQEVHSLCKDVSKEVPPTSRAGRTCLEIMRQIQDLSKRLAKTCLETKQHYANLSTALAGAISDKETQQTFRLVPASPHIQAQFHQNNGSFSTPSPASSTTTLVSDHESPEEILSLESSPIPVRRRHLLIPVAGASQTATRPDGTRTEHDGDSERTVDLGSDGGDRSRSVSKSPTPVLRLKVMTKQKAGEESESTGSLSNSDERLVSPDRWETSSLHSVHSLQTRLVYSTGGDRTCSADSLDRSSSNEDVLERGSKGDVMSVGGSTPRVHRHAEDRTTIMHVRGDSTPADFQFGTDDRSGDSQQLVGTVRKELRQGLLVAGSLQPKRTIPLSKSMGTIAAAQAEKVDLAGRLQGMSTQIQELVHSIAENRRCGLQSLALELHLGELKAMLSMLELEELELVRLRSTFSPSAQRRLAEEQAKRQTQGSWKGSPIRQPRSDYPAHEISTNRDEILKLSERVELLSQHCKKTASQTEEVLEFVMQYEGEVNCLRGFLQQTKVTVEDARDEGSTYHETTWLQLRDALTSINEHKEQLSSIEELSAHLLSLEPVFDGEPVRKELQSLSSDYQTLVIQIFAQLEVQATSRTDQLLQDTNEISVWSDQAEVTMQALTKRDGGRSNGISGHVSVTMEKLHKEVGKRKSQLQTIVEQLQPITAVLAPGHTPSFQDLLSLVDRCSKALLQIENGLKALSVNLAVTSMEKAEEDVRATAGVREGSRMEAHMGHLLRLPGRGGGEGGREGRRSVSPRGGSPAGGYDTLDNVAPSPSPPCVERAQVSDSTNKHPSEPKAEAPADESPVPTTPSPYLYPTESEPKKKCVPYATVSLGSLYDHPQARHSITLHEELLHFINQEWAGLVQFTTAQDEANLLEAISQLEAPEHRITCQHFVKTLDELKARLKGVVEQLWVVVVPKVPDLEEVKASIEHCQKLKGYVEKLYPHVESCNDRSLSIVAGLSRSSLSVRISQLLEMKVFDVSTCWYSSNVQIATRLRQLHDREAEVNSLYQQLKSISLALEEAKSLLREKQNVTDIQEYLQKCKEMRRRLADLSGERDQVAMQIRDSILSNPHSSLSQNLLDQLREVDTHWVNTVKALSEMPALEPILVKQMLINTERELTSIKTAVHDLEDRSLNLEDLKDKCQKCQAHLYRARRIQSCIQESAPVHSHSPVGGSSPKSQSDGLYAEIETLRRHGGDYHKHSQVRQQSASAGNGYLKGNGASARAPEPQAQLVPPPSIGATGQGHGSPKRGRPYTEIVISLTDSPELVPVEDSGQRSSVLQHAERVIAVVQGIADTLENDRAILDKFMTDLDELYDWALETRRQLQAESLPQGKEGEEEEGGTESIEKHQAAVCHQVVDRQPKMESVQSLVMDVLVLPGKEEERRAMEQKLSTLYCAWDDICQQCVPAGAQPLLCSSGTHDTSLQAPSEFEDIAQMIEWLILIESKLQPDKMVGGDIVQMKGMLRELMMIERELRSKEKDYRQFMREASGSVTPELPSPSSINSPKRVRFFDENTLERRQRMNEIKKALPPGAQAVPGMEFPELDDIAALFGGSDSSVWKVPEISAESRPPNLHGTDSTSLVTSSETSLDGQSSLTSSLSHLASPTLGSEEHYQLSILWNGIWTTLNHRRRKLEAVQEAWKAFEAKREAFAQLLTEAEGTTAHFYASLADAKDFTVIDAQFTAQKAFSESFPASEQQHAALNKLFKDMLCRFNDTDDTSKLHSVMDNLNERWTRINESLTENDSTITSLTSNWTDFYSSYQSFQSWLGNMDTEMSYINPFVGDLAAVREQLETQKGFQQELDSHQDDLESLRNSASKLTQGAGGFHVNAATITSKLDNVTRKWDHLQMLARERLSALEQGLSEKQDLLSRMANCLAWISLAERHLTSQRPLGTEFYKVHEQHEAQKGFWAEVLEKKPEIESVISAGKHIAMEMHWPQGMDGLRTQYVSMRDRWAKVWRESEEWERLLEAVYPEMQHFQGLCTGCGQSLTDAEMKVGSMEAVRNRMPILTQQLEVVQQFETRLVDLGDALEAIVTSQKRQLQMGVKVSPELIQLVRRFHDRWNELKRVITERHEAIDRGMKRCNPETMGFASLPRGWRRAKAENGNPYYINAHDGNKTQWEHPELAEMYKYIESLYLKSTFPSPAYPVALKLRALQKRTQLNLLLTRQAMEACEENQCHLDPTKLLSSSDMTTVALSMFLRVDEEQSPSATNRVYINKAVELTTGWIRDIYDVAHEGLVECTCFQLASICLSQGKLEEKYRNLFRVISRNKGSIDLDQLTEFLEKVVQIPQSVCSTEYCHTQSVDVCARDCFRKFVGVGTLSLHQFIVWLQTEPKPLAWLPVLHRLAASECVQHDVKCAVCRAYPIVGFRYRCLQCIGFDMCQGCYWSGKTGKGHDRARHFMEEYCVARDAQTGEDVKDFFKSLQRSFRRKKRRSQEPQPHSPGATGNYSDAVHTPTSPIPVQSLSLRAASRGSPPARKRHATRASENPRHASVALPVSRHLNQPHPAARSLTVSEGRRHVREREETTPSRPGLPTEREQSPSLRPYSRQLRRDLGTPRDLEKSMTKLTEDNKLLYERLKDLRQRRSSMSPPESAEPGGAAANLSTSPEQVMKVHNSFLQGRVQLMREHNRKLEDYIGQLKLNASMQQNQRAPSSTASPLHNGSPARIKHY